MNRTSQGGFTLIEVLVAFMILALSLAVMMRIFSGGLRNVALAADYSRAVLVAEAQLAAAGVSEPLVSGATTGDWDERFHWQRVIDAYRLEHQGDGDLPVNGYRVTVRVEFEHAGQTREVTLDSLRLAPATTAERRG
jgi:general secretion pathway protein I